MPGIMKLLKFEDEPELKFVEAALADGTKVKIDPELKEGAMVTLIAADGAESPAEGEVVLADGTKLNCTAGKIDKITPAEAPVDEEMKKQLATLTETVNTQMKKQLSTLEEKINAVTKENEKLKTQNEAFSKAITGTLELVKEIADAPAAKPAEQQIQFNSDVPKSAAEKAKALAQKHADAIKK